MIPSPVRDASAEIHRVAHSDASGHLLSCAWTEGERQIEIRAQLFYPPLEEIKVETRNLASTLLVRQSARQSNGTCFPPIAATHSTRPPPERIRLDQFRQTAIRRFGSRDGRCDA